MTLLVRQVVNLVVVASCVVLVTACGATDRIGDARKVGGAVRYGAKLAPPMGQYAQAISELQSNQAVMSRSAGPRAALAYGTTVGKVNRVGRDLANVDPPVRFAASHAKLQAAISHAARALRTMELTARRNRPRQLQRASNDFLAAQQEVSAAFEAMARDLDIELPAPPPIDQPVR